MQAACLPVVAHSDQLLQLLDCIHSELDCLDSNPVSSEHSCDHTALSDMAHAPNSIQSAPLQK